jgi:tRNA-splicing ligase RtcB (3'-phosphate/5'-hydroxy nucleic acid ligase)
MRVIDGIPVWGDPVDEGALSQIKTCARTADHAALMADHHKGYAVPIGGVVAYENAISPSGVGFDIACGNKAILTDADASEVRAKIGTIMDDVVERISFGIGQKNNIRVDHELFDDPAWSSRAMAPHKEMARAQLGTVGSGNHYVDIFEDEQGRVWVGCHFGSRGLGHKTATHFLKAAGAKDGMDVEPCVVSVGTPLGDDYLACMALAGRYAYAGRDWVCAEVARILGASVLEEVHNHHNFAWRETHGGRDLWVVRKGATPAFPGQEGFVGGTMGDLSVILEGVESEESGPSLYSTVHGAGRVMSRTEAAGKFQKGGDWVCGQRDCEGSMPKDAPRGEDGSNPKCPLCGSKMHKRGGFGQRIRTGGKVTPEMMREWVSREGVTLRGAGTDESPHCYKRLPEVLAHHGASVRILHSLTPIGVAMAGENEFDPFKD